MVDRSVVDIAVSSEAPDEVDVRQFGVGGKLVGEVVFSGFFDAIEGTKRSNETAFFEHLKCCEQVCGGQLGGFERVLENFRESLRMRVHVCGRFGVSFNRSNVHHEAVASDVVPLVAKRVHVGHLGGEPDRMDVRMPAVLMAMRDFVAPDGTTNSREQ